MFRDVIVALHRDLDPEFVLVFWYVQLACGVCISRVAFFWLNSGLRFRTSGILVVVWSCRGGLSEARWGAWRSFWAISVVFRDEKRFWESRWWWEGGELEWQEYLQLSFCGHWRFHVFLWSTDLPIRAMVWSLVLLCFFVCYSVMRSAGKRLFLMSSCEYSSFSSSISATWAHGFKVLLI